jgi:hypothetical protein
MNHWIKALVLAFAVAGGGVAHAQGTWQSTFQGRDLDNNSSTGVLGFEAFYDTDLDITWLANANVNGLMNWTDANAWASALDVHGIDDWRLPSTTPGNDASGGGCVFSFNNTNCGYNVHTSSSEMAHLFHVSLGNVSSFDTNAAVRAGNTGLANHGPFSGLQSAVYWSGTAYAPSPASAWHFLTFGGGQGPSSQGSQYYAMAVRPGDVTGMVPEPQTYALMLSGLTALWLARRRRLS